MAEMAWIHCLKCKKNGYHYVARGRAAAYVVICFECNIVAEPRDVEKHFYCTEDALRFMQRAH